MKDKIEHPKVKSRLHPRSKHRERYNFKELIAAYPELNQFVRPNKYRDLSVDFSDPNAVKALNTAILKHHYQINWDVPKGYLCPPIPGRADYIHHAADLLGGTGKIPRGNKIKCLDIGIGANCIYPIIGIMEYGWSFIGTDIDPVAIESASKIVQSNPKLKGNIELRLQENSSDIFQGVLKKGERVDLSICNPPFHSSLEEASAGTLRKMRNLGDKKAQEPVLNFGGNNTELWCEGGEKTFIRSMIQQSEEFATSCFWFTTLVSKQSNLKTIYKTLRSAGAKDVKTIELGQGNKSSRIIAWTFLTPDQQKKWIEARW